MNRKIVNWIIILAMVLGMFVITPALVKAEEMSIKLPNGQELPVGDLNSNEIKNLMKLLNKATKKKDEGLSTKDVIKMADDPAKLDAWRKVITGTIKDVCNDLNVTVNEFIKTPVGMGVAGLILYKVIGRDLLSTTIKIIIAIPLWFIIMGLLLYLRSKYYGTTLVYKTKKQIGESKSGKPLYEFSDPVTELKYPWQTNDARLALTITLFGCGIMTTIFTAIIIFGQ